MALRLKQVSDIDRVRQLAVYGYIREYEQVNQVNIPEGIIFVLILFYGDSDRWDPKYISQYMKLSDRTLTQVEYGMGSSYGQRVVDSGIFKWRLRIDQCTNDGFMLGIRRVKGDEADLPTKYWFTKGGFGNGYAFRSIVDEHARLTNDRGFALGRQYGSNSPNGAIIEMMLDLDNLTLSYIINDVDYGKAFDIAKGKYRLGLYMGKESDSLTLF